MGTVNVTLGDGKKLNLILGQQLENAVTAVVFDFSAWQTEFGSGTLGLSVQRHGDTQPYAVVPTVSGTNATWNITELDTAYKGVGEVQVTYTVGSVVKKSTVYKFTVYRSLGENGEYPSPGQTWQEEIEDELADVKQDLTELSLSKEYSGSDNVVVFDTVNEGINNASVDIPYNASGYTDADLVLGSKNLLLVNYTSQTKNGVTFTVNADGTITANGTSTASIVVLITGGINLIEGVSYTLTGAIDAGAMLQLTDYPVNESKGFEDNRGFTFTADGSVYAVRFYIYANQTFNNAVFKPMIRYASITDATFEKYHAPTTYNVPFGRTIYGGKLDVTRGLLTPTYNYDGSAISSPSTYNVTPTDIKSFAGKNYLFCDIGTPTVQVRSSVNNLLLTNAVGLPSTMDDAVSGVYYYETLQSEIPNDDGIGILIAVSNDNHVSQYFISNEGNTYYRRFTGTNWTDWKIKFSAYYKNMNLGDGFGFLKESAYNESGTLKLQEYYDWHNKVLKIRYYSSGSWKDWVTFKANDYITNYSGFLPCKKELSFDTEYNATMGQGIAVYNNFLFAIYNRTDGAGISVYSMSSTEQDGSLHLIVRDLNVEIGHGNAIQFGQVLDGDFPHLFVSGWDDNKVYEIKYDSGTFTQVAVHNLPSNLHYTSVAVNELEKTFYIFNCDVYPEVLYNYDFIKWDYDNETIISQRKTEPFMTMQDCEYACGVILVTGGYGQSSNPSTCYVYDLDGNRIGSVALNSRLSTTEIEGVTYDPITGELYLGQAYYMYRVRG